MNTTWPPDRNLDPQIKSPAQGRCTQQVIEPEQLVKEPWQPVEEPSQIVGPLPDGQIIFVQETVLAHSFVCWREDTKFLGIMTQVAGLILYVLQEQGQRRP